MHSHAEHVEREVKIKIRKLKKGFLAPPLITPETKKPLVYRNKLGAKWLELADKLDSVVFRHSRTSANAL